MARVHRYMLAPLLMCALLGTSTTGAQARPQADSVPVTIDYSEIQHSVGSGDVVVQDDAKAAPQTQIVVPPAAEGNYVLKPNGTIDVDASMQLRHDDPGITNSPDAEIIVFPSDPVGVPAAKTVSSNGFPPILVTVYRRVKNYTMVSASHPAHGATLASRAGRRPLAFYTKVAEKIDIAPIIVKYATRFNLDPYLVKAVIKTESAFNPHATSWCGAAGLMQLMPFTARRMGAQHSYEIDDNIAAGTRYLRYLMDMFGNQTEKAVAAYNAGEGAVQAAGGIPHFAETQQYVRKVMSSYRAYKNSTTEE